MKIKTNYLKNKLSWLLPYSCILCHFNSSRNQDLCEQCFQDLPRLENGCLLCAKSLLEPYVCGNCLKNPPFFERVYALYAYQPPITKLIMDLKFGQALVNARILGELLAEKISHDWYPNQSLPEVVIPIPLHAKRLKERGFNQALEIARSIKKNLDLPLELRCKRIKYTEPQATLKASDRRQNIKNAFYSPILPYSHVAVIDDVMTTGDTVMEFCKVLKDAGVGKIDVWCVARA